MESAEGVGGREWEGGSEWEGGREGVREEKTRRCRGGGRFQLNSYKKSS